MTAKKQDSTTGQAAGGVTRRIKDYCTQAMANLKTGRLKEAYFFANEALELDEKDAKAAALYRHALYALHPKKRLLDKAKTLHEEADRCVKTGYQDKALELLSLAKKWHCTPGVLYTRAYVHGSDSYQRTRYDLAYVDMTEGLAECTDKVPFIAGQRASLSVLGYKFLPVIEHGPVPRPDEMPARYHVSNWPDGIRINYLHVYLSLGHAEAMKIDGTLLKPCIPLDQLAAFLNHHLQGSMQSFSFIGRPQGMVPQLLDEMTVPGRLHTECLSFTDFFHLPWASIERILDGRTLRANMIDFLRLQLPSGVDANELLKLPTVRECTRLWITLYSPYEPQLPGLPPLFNNVALLEWIKRDDGRSLQLTRDYLSSGLLSFLDALKKDFRQATQMHSYEVGIRCPHIDVVAGLGVQDELLSNRLGEEMVIGVVEEPAAAGMMGHRFETVLVGRLPPS